MSELEDLRRDVIELREWKAAIIGKCKASDGFDTLEWGGDKEGWGFIHYFIGHLETRALEAEKHLLDLPQPVSIKRRDEADAYFQILQTIARFPITDQNNMDAMNMRWIAESALAVTQSEGK